MVLVNNTVEGIISWKVGNGKNKTVEIHNKPITDKLGWVNTDVLYSFLGIYVLGLLAYYPEEYHLSKTKYTIQKENVKNIYSKNYIERNYSKYRELNENPYLKEYINLYFSVGNLIPIWPGGNSHRGVIGIYDIPEIYLKKYPEWTEALEKIYDNGELDLVINTEIFFNIEKGYSYKASKESLNFDGIKELLSSIVKAANPKNTYQEYLQRIITIIRTREGLIKKRLEK